MVDALTSAAKLVSEASARDAAVTDLELNLLLEAVVRLSGHDFRDYSPSTLKRRIAERLRVEGLQTISGLQELILHDSSAFARFIFAMSGGGSGKLFRDPAFLRDVRSTVIPLLRTYSFARIWVPNCGSGEDAYSMAVLLHEEGLLQRTMIYATDASELGVAAAKTGIFELDSMAELKAAHRATGSTASLSDVCEPREHAIGFSEGLRKNMIFAQHSLVTDGTLNEFHVILARGILTQFNKSLQFHVHNLWLNSLVRLGFLCLGSNESLRQTPHERVFREVSQTHPIYRRMR
jgi:chemotaxis protein methyltransferase CheR